MKHPYDSSPQRDNFYGVVGLLGVAALACALTGSFFGFFGLAALIGILWTRAQWSRIVTMVVVAYVALVGLLVALFAFGRGESVFAGFVATLIAVAIFWLLLRPGMNEYFSRSAPKATSCVVPVMPRPGALPHLQKHQAAAHPAPGVGRPTAVATAAGNTQEQWGRLQLQLRAEQEKEEREQAALAEASSDHKSSFPWLSMIFTALVFAYASSVAGELGRFSMLLVFPGLIAAMLRWIDPRGFLLCVLVLSGGLILRPGWTIVAPGIRILLQHNGAMVFAAIALLVYFVAVCSSGLADDCDNHA